MPFIMQYADSAHILKLLQYRPTAWYIQ